MLLTSINIICMYILLKEPIIEWMKNYIPKTISFLGSLERPARSRNSVNMWWVKCLVNHSRKTKRKRRKVTYGEKSPVWSPGLNMTYKSHRDSMECCLCCNKYISGLSNIFARIIWPGTSSLWKVHVHRIEKQYWPRIFAGLHWYLDLVLYIEVMFPYLLKF